MKRFMLLLLPVAIITGCGESDTDTDTAEQPASAQATLENIITQTRAGNAGVYWEMLPDSYRKDVNELVHGFGANMDAGAYTGIMEVATSVQTLLDKQSQFIANSEQAKGMGGVEPAELEKGIKAVAALLKAIIDEAGSTEKLQQFDGQKFFAGNGSTVLKQAIALANMVKDSGAPGLDLSALDGDVKVTTLKSTDTSADLEISANDEKIQETWVLHEGKWLPKDLVEGWSQMILTANSGMSNLKEDSKPLAAMVSSAKPAINLALGPLTQAETQEQFDAALKSVQGMLGMMPGLGGGGAGNPLDIFGFGGGSGNGSGPDSPGEPDGSFELSPQEVPDADK